MGEAMHELLRVLGSRYAQAQDQVDELRMRALELVLAACVSESLDRPAGEVPPPSPLLGPVLADESFVGSRSPATAAGETIDLLPEEPSAAPFKPEPEPLPLLEPEVELEPKSPEEQPEDETEFGSTTRVPWEPEEDDRGPVEPVRGDWDRPDR